MHNALNRKADDKDSDDDLPVLAVGARFGECDPVTPGTRGAGDWAVTVTVTVTFVPAGAWATFGGTASYEVPGDQGTPEGGELLYAELDPDG
ncbi:hypothetical protein GT030_22150 [Streptomyces sp. SID1328]|uniref:hypothetical protein n=1 Tax=Streptomyces sp. SID1328 TaxID=2690250 RepID=UPI00136FE1A8|nr:hypothetical protein [Streptomyces sp. SID1328]MYV41376.1 hypothetical protein [Streptomyces sp. SID1328]MYV41494.1 hypothetical protein [Streptomyces sp. SID1328]